MACMRSPTWIDGEDVARVSVKKDDDVELERKRRAVELERKANCRQRRLTAALTAKNLATHLKSETGGQRAASKPRASRVCPREESASSPVDADTLSLVEVRLSVLVRDALGVA
jgi:hypothetical protein